MEPLQLTQQYRYPHLGWLLGICILFGHRRDETGTGHCRRCGSEPSQRNQIEPWSETDQLAEAYRHRARLEDLRRRDAGRLAGPYRVTLRRIEEPGDRTPEAGPQPQLPGPPERAAIES